MSLHIFYTHIPDNNYLQFQFKFGDSYFSYIKVNLKQKILLTNTLKKNFFFFLSSDKLM